MKETILQTLENCRMSLLDGEFFSSASALSMAGQIEKALLNKFDCQKKRDILMEEGIEETLVYHGITES